MKLLLTKARYLFQLSLMFTLCCWGISDLHAQDLVNVSVRVTAVAHNFQCCTDAAGISCGFLPNRPEPRYRVRGRTVFAGTPAAYSATAVINPGDGVTCGTIAQNRNVFSVNGVCADEVEIEVEMWEEDGCGSDNTFENTCTNDDENRTFTAPNFALTTPGVSTQTISGAGGYSVTIEITWSRVSVPTVSGTLSACTGSNATLNASAPQTVPGGVFNWYNSPTGGAPIFVGNPYTPVVTANTTYYVAYGNGTCETNRTAVNVTEIVANPPTTTGASACPGESATLTASAPGAIGFNWYADPGKTTLVGTGSPFITPPLAGTTTYYAAAVYTTCESPVAAAVATQLTPPAAPTAANVAYCEAEDVILTANGSGGTLNWYSDPAGTVLVGTGSPINLGPMAAGTSTYYVNEDDGSCEGALTPVVVTINPLPPVPTAPDVTVCPGSVATLSASEPSAVNFNWYSSAAGAIPLATGSVYTTSAITAPISYYVGAINNFGCEGPREQVDVSLFSAPAPTTSGTTTICTGETTTLTANAATATGYNWYQNSDKTGFLQTGASLTTLPLNFTTTYYVAATYANGCESLLTPVTVTVNPLPPAPVANGGNYCENEDVIVTAFGTGGTINWYDAATGGTLLSTGSTYNAGLQTAGNYVYYVEEDDGSCQSQRTAVLAVVNPAPAAPAVNSPTICEGEQATLIATPTTGTIEWYSDAAMSNLLATGSSYTTTLLSTTTDYYVVEVSNTGCRSMASTATVTVNPAPATPTVSGATICANASTTLTATNSGGTTNWYADAATTILVGTSTSFTTPALVQNTTYYVQETSAAGCNSAIATATVTVNPLPSVPSTAPVIVCEGQDAIITATGSGSGDLVFYDNTQTEIGRTTMSVAVPNASYNAGALPAGNYVFYVGEDDGSCVSILATVGVTVNTTPLVPTATGATICLGETAVLTAVGTGVEWYADAALTTILGVGNNFNPGLLTATTDFYVTQTNANGCQSAATTVTVTVNPNPANPGVSGTSICAGSSAALSVTSSGGTVSWYGSASATPLITTGTTYNTPNLQQTTTYYVQEMDGNGCVSNIIPLTVTVDPLPNTPSANNPVVCDGDDVIITATGSGSGDLVFYDATQTEVGRTTMSVATPNASFNAGALAAGNYVFYVGEDDGTCVSTLTTVSVTVHPAATAPTASGTAICSGNTASLSSTGVGVQWYADAALSNLVGTGNNFNTGILTSSTDFYVTQTNANGCQSAATTVTVTVNPNPVNPTTVGATICAGSSATLTATGTTGTLSWYINAAGTQVVATGATYNTPVLQQTTTYYVQEVDGNGCTSAIVSATATVNPLPNTPSANNPVVCEGDDVILSASGSGTGDLVFYDATMTEIGRTTMSMSNPSATFNAGALLAGTYSFFVREDNGACLSNIATIGVTVNPTPAAPTTTTDTICAGSVATLTATGAGTIGWYTDATLSSQIALGNIFTTNVLSANTSYWVASTDLSGCVSTAAQVDVVVNAAPAAPTASNDTVCAGNAATLTATASAGGTLNWYSDAAGMNLVATGATLSLPTMAQSTTYYVNETDANACVSMSTAAQIVVNPAPTAPAAPAITACDGDPITLSATGSGTGDLVFFDNMGVEIGRGTMSAGNNTITSAVAALAAGTYNYFVAEEQAVGCSSPQVAINVEVLATPAAPSVFNDSPVCEGEDVFLQASTIANANYNWSGPNGFSSTNQDMMLNDVSTAEAGVYTVSVTVNGCSSPVATTTVTVNTRPVISGALSNNGPLCEGETLTITAPTLANVNYNWTGPNGFSSTQTTVSIPNVTEVDHQGFYTLTVEDQSNGCSSEPVSTLAVINKLPDPGMAFSNSPLCVGEDLELSVPEVFNAAYSWTGPNGFTSNDRTPILTDVDVSMAGVYNVEVSIDQCTTLLEVEVNIDTLPNTTVIPDTTVLQGDELVLFATGGITYQWSPGTYLSGVATPTPVFSNAPVGTYTYNVEITSANGCSDQQKVTVEVQTRTDIIITDLFTPNNDGVNDTWVIEFLENVEPYTLQVFSRGGLEVYRSENYMNDWDGTLLNSNKQLPDGTYYYLIRTQFREYTGAVTIKR